MGKFLRSLRSFSRKKSVGIRSYEIVCKPGIFKPGYHFPHHFFITWGCHLFIIYLWDVLLVLPRNDW